MTLSSDPRTSRAAHQSDFSTRSTLSRALAKTSDIQTIPLPGTDSLLKANVPLATLTSFRVGGPAEWYIAPRHLEELQASLEWAELQGLATTMLGAGSNLLISDRGLPGLVISTRHLRHSHFDQATGQVTVGAGKPLPRLAWQLADLGWQGFEWAVGIPGTVGGAVVMNAGAHGDSIADILVEAQILLPNGQFEILTPQALNYRYRTSALQGGYSEEKTALRRLVTQATFQLRPGANPAEVLGVTSHHKHQRLTTQPYNMPSCGSVFRNPGAYKAGWLIEQTGLKGHQIGGAQVAQRHANFILNCGGATASDIFQLIRFVQQQVHQRWSLLLETEVKMMGEFQSA
ncbi:UDP-N-acetylmuramate dehydrogenase [Phormidesmis priestleyi ULC007]|uniref:UDP-N-acetylenolpyruvoylglucosamine reductase n=1 Tax=Phormidesmis priestleyi ULC007 TaxID=1920490 RepID=A0A2T1DGV6_9CYAN|nr:UDP-N-acetylmuramate dehydrogenase [Phormidesmis priestleyi]PSB19739.1 UDP-N-acetylmuramate dehydrogenase [Phormidesmis priestleyi ULC007]PZO53623.1 MAG: UDP-N-acetylmuramate dehydrogenase [Phormidesmis priestleyi]